VEGWVDERRKDGWSDGSNLRISVGMRADPCVRLIMKVWQRGATRDDGSLAVPWALLRHVCGM